MGELAGSLAPELVLERVSAWPGPKLQVSSAGGYRGQEGEVRPEGAESTSQQTAVSAKGRTSSSCPTGPGGEGGEGAGQGRGQV